MNISYIILKHVIWRFQIYNLFREIFKFREDKSNNVFREILKCFRKTVLVSSCSYLLEFQCAEGNQDVVQILLMSIFMQTLFIRRKDILFYFFFYCFRLPDHILSQSSVRHLLTGIAFKVHFCTTLTVLFVLVHHKEVFEIEIFFVVRMSRCLMELLLAEDTSVFILRTVTSYIIRFSKGQFLRLNLPNQQGLT